MDFRTTRRSSMAITTYKTKKGQTRYKAQIWHKNKRLATKTFARKLDANEWHKRKSVQILNEGVGRQKGSSTTLSEFFKNTYWPNKSIREGTAKDYKRIFETHFE